MATEWIEEKAKRQINDVVSSEDLTDDQLEELKDFDRRNVLRGVSLRTRKTYLYRARRVARFLGDKTFTEATREDLEAYLAQIAERTAPSNVRQEKIFLQVLYTVLHDATADDRPEVVAWIKVRPKRQKIKLPDEFLTPGDVKKMAQSTTHPRDTAIVMALYESAARTPEFCGLRIKHVDFDDYGARIRIDGKTGERKVRLLNSVPAIRDWLNHHP